MKPETTPKGSDEITSALALAPYEIVAIAKDNGLLLADSIEVPGGNHDQGAVTTADDNHEDNVTSTPEGATDVTGPSNLEGAMTEAVQVIDVLGGDLTAVKGELDEAKNELAKTREQVEHLEELVATLVDKRGRSHLRDPESKRFMSGSQRDKVFDDYVDAVYGDEIAKGELQRISDNAIVRLGGGDLKKDSVDELQEAFQRGKAGIPRVDAIRQIAANNHGEIKAIRAELRQERFGDKPLIEGIGLMSDEELRRAVKDASETWEMIKHPERFQERGHDDAVDVIDTTPEEDTGQTSQDTEASLPVEVEPIAATAKEESAASTGRAAEVTPPTVAESVAATAGEKDSTAEKARGLFAKAKKRFNEARERLFGKHANDIDTFQLLKPRLRAYDELGEGDYVQGQSEYARLERAQDMYNTVGSMVHDHNYLFKLAKENGVYSEERLSELQALGDEGRELLLKDLGEDAAQLILYNDRSARQEDTKYLQELPTDKRRQAIVTLLGGEPGDYSRVDIEEIFSGHNRRETVSEAFVRAVTRQQEKIAIARLYKEKEAMGVEWHELFERSPDAKARLDSVVGATAAGSLLLNLQDEFDQAA